MTSKDIEWPDLDLPPINLNNSQAADDFYPDGEAPPNGELEDE